MSLKELPTKRRIIEIGLNDLKMSDDDLRKIFYAFRKLVVLKKIPSAVFTEDARNIFNADHETYTERMNWLNEFLNSKGYQEPIFRNPNDFNTSSEDYDYYYELKTEKQLVEEEKARKSAKNKEQNNDEILKN